MKIYATFKDAEGKSLQRLATEDKRRILRKSEATNWQSALLKVVYQDGRDNEGIYFNRKDFNLALNAFTEK